MSRIGLFCFLGRGHLNPAVALGRRLQSRGHEVTVFHIAIAQAAVAAAGLRFSHIDGHEPGSFPDETSTRSWPKWTSTKAAIERHAGHVLREAPEAIRAAGVTSLVIDQMDVAAASVAEAMGLPFVTLSCAPPMYLHPGVPPPFFGWRPATGALTRARNRVANALVNVLAARTLALLNERRQRWGLAPIRHVNQLFSPLAVITQLPRALEFDQPSPCPNFFYAGPLRDHYSDESRVARAFPWHRLDGRPLVYASMGTIRNNLPWVFRTIAAACSAFDIQLVMSLGGRLSREELGPLPGDPIVVPYVPQIQLLSRAVLTINCAGLNTTLDSIYAGVPLVALPVAEDQPGVAARIHHAGVGAVVPLWRLSTAVLRRTIGRVLNDSRYIAAVRRVQQDLRATDGVARATDIVEGVLGLDASPSSHTMVPSVSNALT